MKYVAYYRVSTKQQGKSGLGLDAQKASVQNFTNNCKSCVIAEFSEVESGKQNNRPQLQAAIEFAKVKGAVLLIAKLDRLSRNASFIFQLRDAKVDFVCCDMPDANTLTIGIMALLAQQERELCSKRTKEALARRKAGGALWAGKSNLDKAARSKGAKTMKLKAASNENNMRASGMIVLLKETTTMSFAKIATHLNDSGFKTAKGKEFKAMQVKRLYDKAA